MKSLKALGNTKVHFFDPVDECPHKAGEEELWQESWVIYFWDRQKQVYAFLRVSQEPNKSTGGAHTVWLNAWAPGVQYKNVDTELALTDGEVSDEDCVSNCGGRVVLNYNGKQYELEFSGIRNASVQMHNGFAAVDTMCHVKMGEHNGVGFSETSNRAQGGDKEPYMLPNSRGHKKNGIFSE